MGGKIYFDMPYISNGWGFFGDAGSLYVRPQFIGDDGQIFDLNYFSYNVGSNTITSLFDFVSVIPRYPGQFRIKSGHYMGWSSPTDHDQIYYDNFRYTKGTATIDSDLDGITNNIDNCTLDYNPTQTDSDQFYFDNFNDENISNLELFDGNWVEENGLLTDTNESNADLTKAVISDTYYPINLEIETKIKINSWQSGDVSGRAGVGLRTNLGNGRGYVFTFRDSNQVRFLSDNVVWGPYINFSFDLNEWYWMKFRIQDSNLFGKVWEDGTQEPEEWMLEWQRSDYSTGYASLVSGYSDSTSVSFDEVSVKAIDFNVGDAVGDVCDNCVNVFNPDQNDSDGDELGDACDGIIEGYLRITSPEENDSVLQGSLVQGTFNIKNINGELVEPLINPQYKIDIFDWNNESFIGGYGNYNFYFMAPIEIGEHTIKVKAYANNAWLSHKIKFNVIPHDTDIKINSIKAIQVIEDVNLIAGKATAIKIESNNSNSKEITLPVTVSLGFNGEDYNQTKEFLGDYNFTFYVNNPYEQEGTYQITAEASVDEIQESNQENNLKTITVDVVETKSLAIRFRPADLNTVENSFFKYYSRGDNFYIANEDVFIDNATAHGLFLKGTYPVKDVNITINPKVYCPIGSKSCKESVFDYWIDQDIYKDYAIMLMDECFNDSIFCEEFENAFTKVVGITDRDWFEIHGFGPKSGLANFNNEQLPVFVDYGLIQITAHEMGHGFGLCEEYDKNPDYLNWLGLCPNNPPQECLDNPDQNCNGGISDGGIWVDSGLTYPNYHKMEMYSIDNNVWNQYNVFNYMGSANISYQSYNPNINPKTIKFRRFTDKTEYNHLIDRLKISSQKSGQQEDLNILLISGMLDQNFDINLMEWFVLKGTEFGSEDGNCITRTLDLNDNILNDYNFSVLFEKYPGSDFNHSFLFMGIHFDANIHKIQILCHDENIAERTVSANAPTIEITSPLGGETWDYVHPITWNASDADGDSLFFLLKYSDNNGTTWNSLDYNVTDTNYQFDVGMVGGNTQYKIKVIATDGILTTETVSGTFTILNPDITIEPNEWNLETINNLQNVSQDFNIVNTGNADLNVFDVNYSDNLTITDLVLPVVLQPGQGHVFSVDLNVLDMNLGEFNEDINLDSNDPNQIVKRIKVYGTIEEAKPDFEIKAENISFNSIYPEEDENIQVNVLVENLGDLNAVDVNVKFYEDYKEYKVDNNTVALYHAITGTGFNLIDQTSTHNGFFKRPLGPSWTGNSRLGDFAVSFDGVDDYINVPDHNELDLTDELSVEFWFYLNGSVSWQGLLAKRDYEGDATTNYGLNTNGTTAQWYFRETGAGSYRILYFNAPDANQWHHFLGTFKQLDNDLVQAKVFVNGVLQADSNLSGNLSNAVNSHDLIIGSSAIGAEPFNGLIDEIRISNKVRTPVNLDFNVTKTISFIDANSSELVSVDWNNVQAGEYNIFVVVDEENLFDERNETNNEDYNSITVYSEPILSVEFEVNPSNNLGELFDLNAIIENNGSELLNANAELLLPYGLTTTDSLTKLIGNLSSHTSTKIEWTDINSSQAELYEIIVNVNGTNADENFSVLTSITKIEMSELNLGNIYSDENIGDFNVINFNPSLSYTGLYYHADINGPENYSEDKNMEILFAGETKKEIIQSKAWKETGNYTITVSLYNAFNELIDHKQDSFEVIAYKPSMLTYYSTDGLVFDPEFSSYSDYFSSASDEDNQVMVVYSYDGDLNYSIRNSLTQEWSSPQTIYSGNYPYLVADGNDFHLVYVDENVYYRSYDGLWSSAELVSEFSSVDPVLTLDEGSLYVLFSSNDLTENYNVYLAGKTDAIWRQPMQLTFCEDANCSNPMAVDKGLTDGKLAFGYRKFKGEEYTSLDSNLMYSLFDVNYFYWGNN